jgi:hypothetical protein
MFILSAQASVTEALDGSYDTHNCRVVDVEAPGDTGDFPRRRAVSGQPRGSDGESALASDQASHHSG